MQEQEQDRLCLARRDSMAIHLRAFGSKVFAVLRRTRKTGPVRRKKAMVKLDSWASEHELPAEPFTNPLALVPHGGGVGWASVGDGVLMCDSETVDSVTENSLAGLAYTSEDVPLVTWVPRYSAAQPAFAFKTDRWRTEKIPGPAGTGGIDVEVGAEGQVVIVYSTPDSGVWCATGTDVVGIEQVSGPTMKKSTLLPTLMRSAPPGGLYDATGRRVTEPKAGVYFVREGQTSMVRRVVIVR